MIAILFLIAVIFALALVFTWLAENPGTVTVEWPFLGEAYGVSLTVAIAGLVALIAVVMLTWWIIKGITRAPGAIVDHQRGRARDKGYEALSEGMLALGAGDVGRARALAKQADRKLGHTREPMVLLLEAQTALADERHDDARTLFDEMLDEPKTRPLGLRGLFLEAQREGEHEAARHYAERAASLSPQHAWATDATLEYATLDGDYERALSIVDDQQRVKSIDKARAGRKRAVLLTALAMRELEPNPADARDHARQAHKLDATLVPAAVVEARAHVRLDELRKAAKVLEETWRAEPHPDIATTYVNLRPGDSTTDRLKRAQELERMKPGHVESLLAVAHAALDAGDLDLARKKAEAAIKAEPREGAFLLLADIEEAQTDDGTRVRHWLQAALRAPRDPAWVADGYVSDEWAPVSPVTGRFDAFEWRQPAREIDGPAIEADEALAALPPVGTGGGERSAARREGPVTEKADADTIRRARERDAAADYEGGPRRDGLADDPSEITDAEVVEVKPKVAERQAKDEDDGRMVAMNGAGGGTADRNAEPVTVVSGSGTREVTPPASGGSSGGSAPGGSGSGGNVSRDAPDPVQRSVPPRAVSGRPGAARQGVDLKARSVTRPTAPGAAAAGGARPADMDARATTPDAKPATPMAEPGTTRPDATIVPSGDVSSQEQASAPGEKKFRLV